jgi:galactokinase
MKLTKPTAQSMSEVLALQFIDEFGESPIIVTAPGRVNLIGEHTDYNDGFVFPVAIDFWTAVAASPRNDKLLTVRSQNYSERLDFDLQHLPNTPSHHWSDYVIGVTRLLSGFAGHQRGTNLLIAGNVPQGAGLSSSASLEVAVCSALLEIYGEKLDGAAIAQLCQRAENEFVGARCGIMDQFISVHGKRDHALMLDCRSLEYRLLPLPSNMRLVICNTMVQHSHVGGEYNQRRRECETAAQFFAERIPGVKALRDVTLADLETLGQGLTDTIRRRARHIISEDSRVLQTAAALEKGDMETIARLMAESHNSLRYDFELSCPELDLMVEIATDLPGVYGARMTGGGFGGCTINLVLDKNVDAFQGIVSREYEKGTGRHPEIYVCAAADGVKRSL